MRSIVPLRIASNRCRWRPKMKLESLASSSVCGVFLQVPSRQFSLPRNATTSLRAYFLSIECSSSSRGSRSNTSLWVMSIAKRDISWSARTSRHSKRTCRAQTAHHSSGSAEHRSYRNCRCRMETGSPHLGQVEGILNSGVLSFLALASRSCEV